MSFVVNPFVDDDEDDPDFEVKRNGSTDCPVSSADFEADGDLSLGLPLPLDVFSDYDHFSKENEFNALVVLQRKIEQEIEEGSGKEEARKKIKEVQKWRALLSGFEENIQDVIPHEQYVPLTSPEAYPYMLLFQSVDLDNRIGKGSTTSPLLSSRIARASILPEEEPFINLKISFDSYSNMFFPERRKEASASVSLANVSEQGHENTRIRTLAEFLLAKEKSQAPGSHDEHLKSMRSFPISLYFSSSEENYCRIEVDVLFSLLSSLSQMLHQCTGRASNLLHLTISGNSNYLSAMPLLHRILLFLMEDMSQKMNQCCEGVEQTERISNACKEFFVYNESFPLFENEFRPAENLEAPTVTSYLLQKEIRRGNLQEKSLFEAYQLLDSSLKKAAANISTPLREATTSPERRKGYNLVMDEACVGHAVELTSKRIRVQELINEASTLGNIGRWLREETHNISSKAKSSSPYGEGVRKMLFSRKFREDSMGKENRKAYTCSNEDEISLKTEAILSVRRYAANVLERIYTFLGLEASSKEEGAALFSQRNRIHDAASENRDEFANPITPSSSESLNYLIPFLQGCTGNYFLRAEVELMSVLLLFQDACLHAMALLNHLLLDIVQQTYCCFFSTVHQNLKYGNDKEDFIHENSTVIENMWSSSNKATVKIFPFALTEIFSADSETRAFFQFAETIDKELLKLCDAYLRPAIDQAECQIHMWRRIRRNLEKCCPHTLTFTDKSSSTTNNSTNNIVDALTALDTGNQGIILPVADYCESINEVGSSSVGNSSSPITECDSQACNNLQYLFKIFSYFSHEGFAPKFPQATTTEALKDGEYENEYQKEDFKVGMNEIEEMTSRILEVLQTQSYEASKRIEWLRLQPYGSCLQELVELELENVRLEKMCSVLTDSLALDGPSQSHTLEKENEDEGIGLRKELKELEKVWLTMEPQLSTGILNSC